MNITQVKCQTYGLHTNSQAIGMTKQTQEYNKILMERKSIAHQLKQVNTPLKLSLHSSQELK